MGGCGICRRSALAGTVRSGWSYRPFFVGKVSLAVVATALLNAARGGTLLPAIFHNQLNNPPWPDARPWDGWLFPAVAIAPSGSNAAQC